MAQVSTHGMERVRGRLGLPAKAVERAVANALARGRKRTDFSGSLRKYLDYLWHKGRALNAANNIIIYGQVIYLFAGTTLVTTWPLPSRFHNAVQKHGKVAHGTDEGKAATDLSKCGPSRT